MLLAAIGGAVTRTSLAIALLVAPPMGPIVAAPLDAVNAAIERGDHASALQMLRPLAEQGDADAQFRLGFMYQLGRGVAASDADAATWYRKAALQAHAEARYRLGMMYAAGIGVSRSSPEASRWLRLAAHQGHAPAQLELGLIYAAGVGVKRDDVQALAWFDIAMQRFGPGEHVNRTRAARERDATVARLTPAQIAEAQRLVAEFRPTTQ